MHWYEWAFCAKAAIALKSGDCLTSHLTRGDFTMWAHKNVTQITDDVLRFVTQITDSKAFRV